VTALLFETTLPARRPLPVLVPVPDPPVETGECDAIRRLRATLPGKIMNATELIRALDKVRRDESIPTTLEAFDTLLGGGLPRGKMVELTGRRTAGRFSIAISSLAAATSMGESAALVDLGDHFDPQLAEENGVDLQRMLWIRPKTLKHAVMSAEMIAATGFHLVVLDVGLHPLRSRRVPPAAWVRLGRSAEANGNALLVSTPYPLTGTASEAVVIAGRAHAKWVGGVLGGMTVKLTLEKHRRFRSAAAELPLSCHDNE